MEGWNTTVSADRDKNSVLMLPVAVLPEQDLHKSKPESIPASSMEGCTRPHVPSFLWKNQSVRIATERSVFLKGVALGRTVCSNKYPQTNTYMGIISLTQWVILRKIGHVFGRVGQGMNFGKFVGELGRI